MPIIYQSSSLLPFPRDLRDRTDILCGHRSNTVVKMKDLGDNSPLPPIPLFIKRMEIGIVPILIRMLHRNPYDSGSLSHIQQIYPTPQIRHGAARFDQGIEIVDRPRGQIVPNISVHGCR